jgi:hypothetical protein
MTANNMPEAKLDPALLAELHALQEVEYTRRFAKIEPITSFRDCDLSMNIPMYKYGHKVILNDEGIYLLNRLYAYYKDYSGVAHLNDWHHVHALIKTYPILQELWDQFETALTLCGEHEKVKRGQL